MNAVKKHPYVGLGGAAFVALIAFLLLTNPENISVGILVVPLVLVFLIFYSIAQLFLINTRLIRGNTTKRRIVAAVSASYLTVLVILESTGGISVPDVILMGMILLVASFYISKY